MNSKILQAMSSMTEGSGEWNPVITLYQQYEAGQILMAEFARGLGMKIFMKMRQLHFECELRPNAEFMSPSGKAPFLYIDSLAVSDFDSLVKLASSKGKSLSAELTDLERAEMTAYMSMIKNVLVNAELYFLWCDNEVYNKVTQPRYGSMYAWPLNFVLPWQNSMKMTRLLSTLGWSKKTLKEVCQEVTVCCAALSEKLGSQKYFFGDSPTELDALVFGHLYALLTTTMPTNTIAEIVENFPNLLNFCKQIDTEFFTDQLIRRSFKT